MRFPLSLFAATLMVILLTHCRKDQGVSPDMGYDYFPVDVGQWVIYDVDSIVHNNFTSTVDSFHFQIKERIAGIFVDNEGRNTQRLERWKKMNDTTDWTLQDVWYENRLNTTAQRVEENVRYIKLIFPVKEGKTWNGNAYNTEGDEEYEYTATDVPATLNNISYDSTLTVLQTDEPLVISYEHAEEKYAKGVGMIFRQYIFLDYQNVEPGLEYTMRASSYGSN